MSTRKLTAETKEQVIGALRIGADVATAAAAVGVSRQAIYKLRDRDAKYAERMDEARAFADEKVIRSLFKAATEDRNVTATIFWLKNRRSDEWRDRHRMELTDPEGEKLIDGEVLVRMAAMLTGTVIPKAGEGTR